MHERFNSTPFSDVRCLPEVLSKPLKRRKPTTFFVCNTSDLFHPAVPFEFIAAVYGVMAATPQHTYLTCTKRPERRAEFMRWIARRPAGLLGMDYSPQLVCAGLAEGATGWRWTCDPAAKWPLPNVWEGVTVENQERAKERLYPCPDWISAEPLLGPIDFDFASWGHESNGPQGWIPGKLPRQIIIGGESGPNARPCDVAWIRDIVRQCREADVRCFVKQLGSKPTLIKPDWAKSRSGSDPSEWPEDLQVRELGWHE
jgi:protein gp37